MPSPTIQPTSICILRLSAIGDCCHALASVQAIKEKYPKAQITWVIGKVEFQLMRHLIDVNWVVFDKKQGLKAYKKLYQTFKGQQFDILLHMQVALRASLASLCIRAIQKWGFDASRAKEGQWLFTNRQIKAQNKPHVAQGFWAFAQAIGATQSDKPQWPELNIPAFDLTPLLDAPKMPMVVISPAASNPVRNWLPERYAKIADYLISRGYAVVLSGGPSEMEQKLAEDILQASRSPIINLVGKTSLIQLLSLIQQAEILIAPDSGPAHMACLVDTPVVGLYAHSNPQRTGPYKSQDYVLSVYASELKNQTGKSIEQNPWGKRVKGDDLMSQISCEQVIEKLELVIGKNYFFGQNLG